MTYFKSLFFNFLTVFFANHIIPGLHIDYYTKLPHIEGDIIFAFSVGFLNSLVYPIMRLLGSKSHFRIGLVTFFISVGAYSIVNLLPIGVHVVKASGFVWCSLVVWFCAYLTNHLELRRYLREKELKDAIEEKEREHEEEIEEKERDHEEEIEDIKDEKDEE